MLEENIKKLTEGVYPFHMPGHKRQSRWLSGLTDADITEITGADDLHNPVGIIAEAQRRAARLFGAVSTVFLSGGSTCGILSSVAAVCNRGDAIVIARNCHKSVYNACMLNGLNTAFVFPTQKLRLGLYGEVLAADIDTAMKKSGARAVVITSPTYEGVVSDIKAIAKTVHKNGGVLIVDSAHGAHLGLSDYFPKSARELGADIVIESAHKTLPCLTGAAMLHICSHRVSYRAIQNQLGIFETSSPSYPILCSIDRALSKIAEEKLFPKYVDMLDRFYLEAKSLKHISLFESSDFDRGKIVISVADANISGFEVKKFLLEKYKIELEMAMPRYALAMSSVADESEGFERLLSALREIDKELSAEIKPPFLLPPEAHSVFPLYHKGEVSYIKPDSAVGRVSAEYIYAYPPGSPIVAVGERFSKDVLECLGALSSSGAQILSSVGKFPDFVAVFEE